MKNYYKILGVLDDAEDIVIRAAYKALAQRYHPDKWKGDQSTANQRMADINEAYAILSDETQRKQYDQEYFKFNSRNDAENSSDEGLDDIPNEEVEGWELAIEFFPLIQNQYDELKKISGILANTFRTALLATRNYNNSTAIKEKFESDYLIKFYGENVATREFAKRLLTNGNSKAAIKLNKILRLMGNSVDFHIVKNKIFEEFPSARKGQYKPNEISEINKLIERIKSDSFLSRDLVELLEKMHDIRVIVKSGLLTDHFSFSLNGEVYNSISYGELLGLCRHEISKW